MVNIFASRTQGQVLDYRRRITEAYREHLGKAEDDPLTEEELETLHKMFTEADVAHSDDEFATLPMNRAERRQLRRKAVHETRKRYNRPKRRRR
jgi:hypothetical protein